MTLCAFWHDVLVRCNSSKALRPGPKCDSHLGDKKSSSVVGSNKPEKTNGPNQAGLRGGSSMFRVMFKVISMFECFQLLSSTMVVRFCS